MTEGEAGQNMNLLQVPEQYQDGIKRDTVGYGRQGLKVNWPDNARIAISFVLNYEEGGEYTVLNGDLHSEKYLNEYHVLDSYEGRNVSIESSFEYGSRVGVWRILEEFQKRNIQITLYGVARALELNSQVVEFCLRHDHEIANHGYRWIDHAHMSEEEEMQHMEKGIKIIQSLTNGKYPLGLYIGRDSVNTPRLIEDHGGLLYQSDSYNDDLPYYKKVQRSDKKIVSQLVIPYSLDNNDMHFVSPFGFSTAQQFFSYLKDAFDVLYEEGKEGQPKMMSVGLHCRLIGKPGRIEGLCKFLDYAKNQEKVLIARRMDIAKYWRRTYPYNI